MHDEPTTQPSFPGAGEPEAQPQHEAAPPAGDDYYQQPPTPPSRSRRRGFWDRRRNRWLVAVGAALVLLIAVAGGVAFAAHQNDASAGTFPAASASMPAAKQKNPVYTVVSVNGTTISATRSGPSGGNVTITVTTTAKTAITRGGQLASLSDLSAGTKFRVRGKTQSDGSITAQRIEIVLPAVKGTLTAINGDTLTVQTRKKTITVRITPSTMIVDATTRAHTSASSLTIGGTVTIQGVPNGDGSYSALRILAGTPQRSTTTATPTATSAPSA